MAGDEARRPFPLSLRAKFYLMMLPLVALLVALLIVSVLPANDIIDLAAQADPVASDALAARAFQVMATRQARVLASAIAGDAAEPELEAYEDSRAGAEKALKRWSELVNDERIQSRFIQEAATEDFREAERYYEGMTADCELALAQVREGRYEEGHDTALRVMDTALGTLAGLVGSHVRQADELLEKDLDYLRGTIDGTILFRAAGMEKPVSDLTLTISNAELAGEVAFSYEYYLLRLWSFTFDPSEETARSVEDTGNAVREDLETLERQLSGFDLSGDQTPLAQTVSDLRGGFDLLSEKGDVFLSTVSLEGPEAAVRYADENILDERYYDIPGSFDKVFEALERRIGDDLGRIRSGANTVLWSVVAVSAVVLLLGLGVPWLLSRKVVSPVIELKEAAERIGAGEMDTEVEVKSRDELGELAGSFNRMARERRRAEEGLRKARDELEDRVEERTAELADANRELEEINRELDGYAHTVSHDLKGPLASALMGCTALQQLVLEGDLEKERGYAARLLEIMTSSMEQSRELIDDILALAEAGQVPREVTRVDISEVVDRVVKEKEGLIREKGAVVSVDEDLGTVIAGRTHIYQVFTNLLGNALKHNDSDRPEIQVRRLGTEEPAGTRLLVCDNGSGIPEDEIEMIFTPFFRGSRGDTGIGLATVHKVVDLYGGTIRAYNRDGACFELTIRDFQAGEGT